MTNYELIQMLVEYPPNAEIIFKVGPLSGYDCDFRLHEYKDYSANSSITYNTKNWKIRMLG